MMQTRRAALAAIVAAPVAVTVPLVASAIAEAPTEADVMWAATVQHYRAALNDRERALGATSKVEEAFVAQRPQFPVLKMHIPVPDDIRQRLKNTQAALYLAGDMVEVDERMLASFEREGMFPAETARLRRCIDDHHAEVARLRVDLDAAEDRSDHLCDAHNRALRALIEMPAPNWSALIEKVEIIQAEFEGEADVAPILADIKRLSGAAHG